MLSPWADVAHRKALPDLENILIPALRVMYACPFRTAMQKAGLRTSVEWAASLLTTQLYHACLVEGQVGYLRRITEALDQKRNPNASIYYTELEPLMVAVELLRHFHSESDDVNEKLLLADAISAIKWEVQRIAEGEYSRVEAKAYDRVANALRRHGKRVPKSKAPAKYLSA